jgi:hypothetical protein
MLTIIRILLVFIINYFFISPWQKMKKDERLKGRILDDKTFNSYGKSHNPKFYRHGDEIKWMPFRDDIKKHPYLKKRNFLGFQKRYRGWVESVNRDGTITMQIVVKNEDEDGKNGIIENFTIKNIESISLYKFLEKPIILGNKDFIASTPKDYNNFTIK